MKLDFDKTKVRWFLFEDKQYVDAVKFANKIIDYVNKDNNIKEKIQKIEII